MCRGNLKRKMVLAVRLKQGPFKQERPSEFNDAFSYVYFLYLTTFDDGKKTKKKNPKDILVLIKCRTRYAAISLNIAMVYLFYVLFWELNCLPPLLIENWMSASTERGFHASLCCFRMAQEDDSSSTTRH